MREMLRYGDASLCLDIRVVKEHLTKERAHTGRIIASLERLISVVVGMDMKVIALKSDTLRV